MPGFHEKTLADGGFDAHYSGVLEIDTVVVVVTEFCSGTPLPVKSAHIIIVLQNSLMEVLDLADVSGGAFRARNSVYNSFCSFFWRAVLGSWRQAPKR